MADLSEDAPDVRLKLYIWDQFSNHDPRIETFPPDQWGKAIDRARALAWGPERLSRVQVVDAWSMLIAQFTSKHIILPEHLRDRDG
jgi:hypothetical protein